MSDATPMMQQYRRMKAEVGDALLFFRLGDFYEMFHEDAIVGARLLDLTLTARGREQGGEGYPMCGVPHHAADNYVARLVQAGRKVAICEQVEDARPEGRAGRGPDGRTGKGIVRREIVRIVTPGTSVDDRLLAPSSPSYLTALLVEQGRIGLAHVELTTGEVRFSEHDPEAERDRVVAELSAFGPREVLLPEGSDRARIETLLGVGSGGGGALPAFTEIDEGAFGRQAAKERIAERWRVGGLGAFGLEGRPAATRALGAALAYLEHATRADLSHLEPPRAVESSSTVAIDPSTRRNLEIVESLREGDRESTLLFVLDRTATSMGARVLRSWLLAPLREVAAIEERLDAVEELAAADAAGRSMLEPLDRVGDLERRLARIVMGSANARDLLSTADALACIPAVKDRLAASGAALLGRLGDDLDPLPDLRAELERAIAEDAPATLRDGGLFREGWSSELDELRSLARSAREHLARLESRERERTGIASLKVRHNKVFGYYLEVTATNLAKVPADWQRRQTIANGERYTTEELRELESRILSAQDRSLALEAELFESLRAKVAAHADALRRTARALGATDALASLAAVAVANGYVRPKVDDSTALVLRGGRHPVVERMRLAPAAPGLGDGRFVPNDTDLDATERQIVVLTGPNMGGKSTYLRQVALITLMAQAGSFVPAESARIGVVDRIFTRVGASDHLASGQSTFMVEMTETARILHEATGRSLVVLDEIGRGTSTFDGLSIAWAVAEYLHETPRVAARTLFATHYHELTELQALYPRVRNLRMATREWKGDIVFLHRVEEGAGDRSYGIQVARLAGLPSGVVARAREVLENLQRAELDPSGAPRLARHETSPSAKAPRARAPQLPLFGEDPRLRQLADRLAAIDVDALTPRGALDLLAELRDEAKR